MSLIVEELPIPVFCADVMPNGTIILGSNKDGTIFRSVDEQTFEAIYVFPDAEFVHGILCDSRGNIFVRFGHPSSGFSKTYDNELYRSKDGGYNWEVVLQTDKGTAHPLMLEGSDGSLYIGTRGVRWNPDTPIGESENLQHSIMDSEIWRSREAGNPGTWELIYEDPVYTKHWHGLESDPIRKWLYAMTGESYNHPEDYIYYIMRSKDGGETWTKIVKLGLAPNNMPPWTSRPPLGLCYYKGMLYFGTDVKSGNNGIWRVKDLGDEGPNSNYPIEKVTNLMDPTTGNTPIVMWLKSSSSSSYLLASNEYMIWYSKDGQNWNLAYNRGIGNPCFMRAHKWSQGGNLYVGSGILTGLAGLKVFFR
jgi:hypothetical protein